MHLFETEEGDRWVCISCGKEHVQLIKEKNWEYIFDKDNPMLRCSFCAQGDYEIED
jgi:rubredoxin